MGLKDLNKRIERMKFDLVEVRVQNLPKSMIKIFQLPQDVTKYDRKKLENITQALAGESLSHLRMRKIMAEKELIVAKQSGHKVQVDVMKKVIEMLDDAIAAKESKF